MDRINLSRDEKKVLKMLKVNQKIISPPPELRAAICELADRQFVIIADDIVLLDIIDIKLFTK